MDAEHQNAMYHPDFVRAVNQRRREAAEVRRREEAHQAEIALAKRIALLKAKIDRAGKMVTIKDIAVYVSEARGIPLNLMIAKTGRTRQAPEIEQARFEAIVLIHEKRPDISANRIGQFFNRDHSSVLAILWKYAKAEKYRGSGPRPEGYSKCG